LEDNKKNVIIDEIHLEENKLWKTTRKIQM